MRSIVHPTHLLTERLVEIASNHVCWQGVWTRLPEIASDTGMQVRPSVSLSLQTLFLSEGSASTYASASVSMSVRVSVPEPIESCSPGPDLDPHNGRREY